MVGRETHRADNVVEHRIDPGVDRNHIAVEITKPFGESANVLQKIRLEIDACLVIVERGWQIDLNHLAVSRPIIATSLDDKDSQAGKAFKESQSNLDRPDMALAHDGKNKHGASIELVYDRARHRSQASTEQINGVTDTPGSSLELLKATLLAPAALCNFCRQ
jgi:hypothetical protein